MAHHKWEDWCQLLRVTWSSFQCRGPRPLALGGPVLPDIVHIPGPFIRPGEGGGWHLHFSLIHTGLETQIP